MALIQSFLLLSWCLSISLSSPAQPSRLQSHQVSFKESILRFPFADFLVNPCGYMPSSVAEMSPVLANWPGIVTAPSIDDSDDAITPPPTPMRILASDGTPLVQQARDFLIPFLDRYVFYRNHSTEQRNALNQELQLAILEAKHYVHQQLTYQSNALHQCDGLHLQSLPHDSALLSTSGEVLLHEVYRALMISAAHLHLIVRDAQDSGRYCPAETSTQQRNIRKLTGKVETLMCLMLHSTIGPEDYDNMSFFHIAQRVVQANVHRYFDCSAREVRGCLVIRYTDRILGTLQMLFNKQQRDQKSPSPPTRPKQQQESR